MEPTVTVQPHSSKEEGPSRDIQTLPPAAGDRVVSIVWSNKSYLTSLPLIYVLTISIPVESHKMDSDQYDLFGETRTEEEEDGWEL